MNTSHESSMESNSKSRIVVTLAVGVVIFLISALLPKSVLSSTIPRLTMTQTMELVLALLAIALLGKGNFSQYGFRLQIDPLAPSGGIGRWILYGVVAVAVGALASIAIMATGAVGNPLIKELSIPQIMLFVWIFSSTIEEIFTRGFLQSHIAAVFDSSVRVPVLRVDIPTLISALFFACMHLIILTHGAGAKTLVIILLFTFSVGLIAGHLRARTGSLIPAIGAHMLANIGGVLGGLIYVLFTILTGGKLPGM